MLVSRGLPCGPHSPWRTDSHIPPPLGRPTPAVPGLSWRLPASPRVCRRIPQPGLHSTPMLHAPVVPRLVPGRVLPPVAAVRRGHTPRVVTHTPRAPLRITRPSRAASGVWATRVVRWTGLGITPGRVACRVGNVGMVRWTGRGAWPAQSWRVPGRGCRSMTKPTHSAGVAVATGSRRLPPRGDHNLTAVPGRNVAKPGVSHPTSGVTPWIILLRTAATRPARVVGPGLHRRGAFLTMVLPAPSHRAVVCG
mmetsp:Transcript_5161/g.12815  ORF Transcript_5161/g.12815 Transcript_5161/m.12815 type:complete len:251 (+) Transcript_5161:224-976(+)